MSDKEEIRNQLKDQVLRVLVEENLKIQEATRLGLFITSEELENAIRMLENRLGFEENTLIKSYASKNIPEITIYNQVRAQLLWQKILSHEKLQKIKFQKKNYSIHL